MRNLGNTLGQNDLFSGTLDLIELLRCEVWSLYCTHKTPGEKDEMNPFGILINMSLYPDGVYNM